MPDVAAAHPHVPQALLLLLSYILKKRDVDDIVLFKTVAEHRKASLHGCLEPIDDL
jgi:hypothetical protein